MTNSLQQVQQYGQSFWLDYVRRKLVSSGELCRLIDVDAINGQTSNPTIFEKAIDESTDYDAEPRTLLESNPRVGTVASIFVSRIVNTVPVPTLNAFRDHGRACGVTIAEWRRCSQAWTRSVTCMSDAAPLFGPLSAWKEVS